ncbi:MAG: gliding motility-associated C-terminal domain-containing protein [Ferruginibacter sp.]
MIARPLQFHFYLLFTVLCCTSTFKSHAQICVNKYTGIKFGTKTYENFTHSAVTATGEIISAGKLYDYNHNGHIAKYSAKGSPVWSYTYRINFFDFVKLTFFGGINTSDIISTPDGGFVIAGSAEQVLPPYGPDAPVKKWGLMARMDRFGKVLWTKTLWANGHLSITNIYRTKDGDFIAYLAADNGYKRSAGDHSYNRVLRIGADGKIKWSTYLFTYLFDAGGLGVETKRAITQASNNNIVIGDVAHKTVAANGQILEGNLHFFELDYNTGNVNWEASHEYGALDNTYMPDVLSVKELGNGKFSFITSLYLPGTNGLVQKGANIITNDHGAIENIIAYSPANGSACSIKQVAVDKSSGNRVLLMDNKGQSILMSIDDNGQPVWQQGYNDEQGAFPSNCFSAGGSGFNIFGSNNQAKQYRLLITDNMGAIDCANDAANIIATPATMDITHDSMVTNTTYRFDEYYDFGHPLVRDLDYPLVKNIICQQTLACCTDIIDTVNVNRINICEGSSYMLPDSTIVQDSGMYYVTFKTALGCDSVKYYNVIPDKNINKFTLGNDSCLGGKSNITVKGTAGFGEYFWMGSAVADSFSRKISQEGLYYATVSNTCGSKTDSIYIFDSCDYDIYMPTAFTPNNDRLNDYFRISPLNKNRLISFSIYNRWGKQVFLTKDATLGWDGTYKNEPQPSDTFVYYIEMEGITGKRLTKKGQVLLLR